MGTIFIGPTYDCWALKTNGTCAWGHCGHQNALLLLLLHRSVSHKALLPRKWDSILAKRLRKANYVDSKTLTSTKSTHNLQEKEQSPYSTIQSRPQQALGLPFQHLHFQNSLPSHSHTGELLPPILGPSTCFHLVSYPYRASHHPLSLPKPHIPQHTALVPHPSPRIIP